MNDASVHQAHRLDENQRQRDDAETKRERVVVEGNSEDAVLAGGYPDQCT